MKNALESGRLIWIAVAIAFVYVVWFNFQKFVVLKEYDFYVEAPCDTTSGEACHLRDCEVDECPPNGLTEYKVWKILARDFTLCADQTCDEACSSGLIPCEAIPCDPATSACSPEV